jgi:hypothetical protein
MCGIYIPCMSARLSAIVVELGVDVVERVNVLKPSGHHRYYLGMTVVKDVISVHVHYEWRPSN